MPAVKVPNGAAAATLANYGSDLIGALPDELLQRVLSFLPAQQAVRTCVLARRWLHLWKSATGLRIVGADGKKRASFGVVREFVDHLLRRRGGSPLETFEFLFEGFSDADVPRLSFWIQHALACRAQVLRLDVVGDRGATTRIRLDDAPLVSLHLTRLELRGVLFKDKFANFSCCPSLRALQIEDCNLAHANRISCPSLEHLSIYGTSFSCSSRIRIHAPNLITLQLHVHYGRTPVLETASPSLRWAVVTQHYVSVDLCRHLYSGDCYDGSCRGCRNIQNDNSCVLLQGLSRAKNLVLAAGTKMFIFRRDLQWCPTFSMLKTLVLNENLCVPNVDALAYILEHSPVLEELFLQIFCKGHRYKVQMKGRFDPKELPSTISPHLMRVEVKREAVDETVLKVLMFLSKLNICFSFME